MQTIEEQYEVKNNDLEEFANKLRMNQRDIDRLKWHITYDLDNEGIVSNVKNYFYAE